MELNGSMRFSGLTHMPSFNITISLTSDTDFTGNPGYCRNTDGNFKKG